MSYLIFIGVSIVVLPCAAWLGRKMREADDAEFPFQWMLREDHGLPSEAAQGKES